MADNPYVNKVQYGNQVLIDITDSTVNPNTLLAGYKAYGADGAPVNGALQLSYHITLHKAQYDALSEQEKEADENWFYLDDVDELGVELDDSHVSLAKTWSSNKIDSELQDIKDMITDEYDPEKDDPKYMIGDYCIYNNGLYICNTDNTNGAWDSSKWTARKIEDLLKQVKTNQNDISTLSSKLYPTDYWTPNTTNATISSSNHLIKTATLNIFHIVFTTKASSGGGWFEIGRLAAAYRPSTNLYCVASSLETTSISKILRINTDGYVHILSSENGVQYVAELTW